MGIGRFQYKLTKERLTDTDESLVERLVIAFEILYNEKILCFEKKGNLDYDYFLGHAQYIVNYRYKQQRDDSTIISIFAAVNEVLDKRKDIPNVEIIKNIFNGNTSVIDSYISIIKEMETTGLISIKSLGEKPSYDKIVSDIMRFGYTAKFDSFNSIAKGTIIFESPDYIIYKSLLPKIRAYDYTYSVYPYILSNLEFISEEYKAGRCIPDTSALKVPNEAFDISVNKVGAVCKLVWLQYNAENNVSSICINVIRDYFRRFYKLSERQIARLDDREAESFVKDYFKLIEKGFNESNVVTCKKLASSFFTIEVQY